MLAWWCVAGVLAATPVSQAHVAGLGGLTIQQEPLVDLQSVDAQVELVGDTAHVTLRYLLQSRAGARNIQLAWPVVVRRVELDGDGPAPFPLRAMTLKVNGVAVQLGQVPQPGAVEEEDCAPPVDGMPRGPASSWLARAAVVLKAGAPTAVELKYRVPLTHDDWRDGAGVVVRSGRALCLRAGPRAGFLGVGKGTAVVRLTGTLPAGLTVEPAPPQPEDNVVWRGSDVDLRTIPALRLLLPAPATSVGAGALGR